MKTLPTSPTDEGRRLSPESICSLPLFLACASNFSHSLMPQAHRRRSYLQNLQDHGSYGRIRLHICAFPRGNAS